MTHWVNQGPKMWGAGGGGLGFGNLIFFYIMHIYDFYTMANANIPFLLTLGKPETQLWEVGNLQFCLRLYDVCLQNGDHFSLFFIMANLAGEGGP